MENMDYDKVLVRMDGSRRLTTRNRRFVKQILSPVDLPNLDVSTGPVQRNDPSPVVDSVDKVPAPQPITETSDDVGQLNDIDQYRSGAGEVGDGTIGGVDNDDGFLNNDTETNVQSESPIQTGSMLQPAVGRPQRDRKQNVRYSAEEYDLAKLSAFGKGLLLSGLYVKQVRPKDRGRY